MPDPLTPLTILSKHEAQTARRVAHLAAGVVALVEEFHQAPRTMQTQTAYRAQLFDSIASLVVGYAADAQKERETE